MLFQLFQLSEMHQSIPSQFLNQVSLTTFCLHACKGFAFHISISHCQVPNFKMFFWCMSNLSKNQNRYLLGLFSLSDSWFWKYEHAFQVDRLICWVLEQVPNCAQWPNSTTLQIHRVLLASRLQGLSAPPQHPALRNKEAHLEKVKDLFNRLGAEKCGEITYLMFEEKINAPEVREYFSSLGLVPWACKENAR